MRRCCIAVTSAPDMPARRVRVGAVYVGVAEAAAAASLAAVAGFNVVALAGLPASATAAAVIPMAPTASRVHSGRTRIVTGGSPASLVTVLSIMETYGRT